MVFILSILSIRIKRKTTGNRTNYTYGVLKRHRIRHMVFILVALFEDKIKMQAG